MQGHGVASGISGDPRYPKGTLAQQKSYFEAEGIDFQDYYLGTINVDIRPYFFQIKKPKHFIENVNWSDFIPSENFYFFDVLVEYDYKIYEGLIYLPDPNTKIEHFQNNSILELILPKLENLKYGDAIFIVTKGEQIQILK